MQHIAKTLNDLDMLAVALPDILIESKSPTLVSKAGAIAAMSELLRLEILLEKPPEQISDTALQLLTLIKQGSLLTTTSRVSQQARLTMALAERLATTVDKQLKAKAP